MRRRVSVGRLLTNMLMIAALSVAVSLVNLVMDRSVPAALHPFSDAPATAVASVIIAAIWHRRLVARAKEREAILGQLEAARAEMERLSITDQLTGLLNRRGFEDALQREVAECERTGSPFCLAIVDVNELKIINDTLGHFAGDKVLQATAEAIASSVRKSDAPARIGGDEFAVILPGCTDSASDGFADRLRAKLTDVQETSGLQRFSVSLGMARSSEGLAGMLQRADARMFAAKVHGGNKALVRLPGNELIVPGEAAA